MVEHAVISGSNIEAAFNARGAELVSLKFNNRELLWNGDPAWWDYRAPLLFPIIGKPPNGAISLSGVRYPMPPHGFVRDLAFDLMRLDVDQIEFSLLASPQTRMHFPFDFTIRMSARIEEDSLSILTTIHNGSDEAMPYCFGYHPGFLWPQEQARRERYAFRFEKEESAMIRRIDQTTGLLMQARFPRPFDARTYQPLDAHFASGAVIFDSARSRRLWFGPKDETGIEIEFPECPQLAIWTRPGAPFLCIEPWQGMTANEFDGEELTSRIGTRTLAPRSSTIVPLRISPGRSYPDWGT